MRANAESLSYVGVLPFWGIAVEKGEFCQVHIRFALKWAQPQSSFRKKGRLVQVGAILAENNCELLILSFARGKW